MVAPLGVNSYFNSRPCGRGDRCLVAFLSRFYISIHAPAGGATRRSPSTPNRSTISIHAPAGGATAQRERQPRLWSNFNSRPCGRGDSAVLSLSSCATISIHAPAGGATDTYHVFAPTLRISIHAPAGGATFRLQSDGLCPYFNSRPCGRGDSKRVQKKKMTIVPFAEKRGKFILL